RADQPVAVAVVEAARPRPMGDQPELDGELEVGAPGLQVVGQRTPLGRRVAELEPLGGLGGHAAPREVGAPRLAAPGIEQGLTVERRRELVDLEHPEALDARALLLRRLLDARDRDTEPTGELLGGLDEALALELHHEAEHVAVLLAAE